MLTEMAVEGRSAVEANITREFCGNRETVRALAAMVESRRMPHAFIVEGADGLGKSTFARLIARGAMCTCSVPLSGECSHCRKLRANIHPDLIPVLGSGKINAISIDSVRQMRADSLIAPNEADKRVFLLEDCDNMLPAAQNAFLKIFEEAPPHVVFVMTCRSSMHLLETIRSRGRMMTLHPVETEEAAAFLCRCYPQIGADDAAAACEKCGGNLGEALRLLGGESSEFADRADRLTQDIVAAMCGGSELALAARCAAIGKDRALAGAVCLRLSEAIRRALMVAVGAHETLEFSSQEEQRLGATVSAAALMVCLEEISTLSDWLKINISMPLFCTRLAIVLQRR